MIESAVTDVTYKVLIRRVSITNVGKIRWCVIYVWQICFSQHRVIYYLTLLLGHSPAVSQRLVPLFTVSIWCRVCLHVS